LDGDPAYRDVGESQAYQSTHRSDPFQAGAFQPQWWDDRASESLLDQPRWVAFGLDSVLLDTLDHSPRIRILANQTSVALERIVQQDAAFDARVLFDSRINRNNDPVGNTLTTGGPLRLIDENLTGSGGIQRTTRRGGLIDVSQEIGLANSNSLFFEPADQGNSRLSLSLNQPLLDRSGQFYNERLLAQARIDSRVNWQQMRGDVEARLADVVTAYWRLYELRCHYLQTVDLLNRGREIERFLSGRTEFDAGTLELTKVRVRVARRKDREIQLRAEIKSQQATLAQLVGSETLMSAMTQMEMIPTATPSQSLMELDLRAAVKTGIENRAEIRSATAQLESAALSIRVTRAELQPQLSAVFEAYLAGLNGNNNVLNSWTDQFTRGGPGMAAGLQYEMPQGRRAAKSRHREAQHRYRSRNEELKEAVQQVQAETEIALVRVQAAQEAMATKRQLLETAVAEEAILMGRWEMLAGDGTSVGVVLETVLDAQTRRTEAERGLVSARVQQAIAVVQLQRAMGTLLIRTGISPVQDRTNNQIHFVQTQQPKSETILLEDAIEIQEFLGFQEVVSKPIREVPFTDPNDAAADIPVHRMNDPISFDPLDLNDDESQGLPPPVKRPPVSQADPPQRRNDVQQLVDAEWLEEAMYGDLLNETQTTEKAK
jgi:outer membrane protein TolC